MSDIDFGTPPDPTPEPAPSPEPQPAPAADDLFANPLGEDNPVVSRGFAENLRAEGLKYRTELREREAALKAYEDIYGPYTEQDRKVWFELASDWRQDPAQAAAKMQAIAKAVLEEAGDEAAETMPADMPAPATPDANGMLSAEQVKEMIAEALGQRDKQAQDDQMVATVLTEIRAEGFNPEDNEGMMLLWIASNHTKGDIKAAAQQVRDYRQSIIDGYVAGRANGTQPSPTSANGVPATELPQVGGWDDIRRNAAKFMDAASSNNG